MPDDSASPEAILRMLLAHAGESFEDRLRQELAKETFVGGKRVIKQKLPALPKRAGVTVHVVKVNLYGAKPPVWRRLEIPSSMTLDRLHKVLQVAFDWYDWHLHSFETICGEFGDPSQDDDLCQRDEESKVAIAQVAAREKAKVVYTYNFRDDYRHDLVVEKILPAAPGVAYPRCTAGRGQTPSEGGCGILAFNEMRAQGLGANGSFYPADLNEALAYSAVVLTPRS